MPGRDVGFFIKTGIVAVLLGLLYCVYIIHEESIGLTLGLKNALREQKIHKENQEKVSAQLKDLIQWKQGVNSGPKQQTSQKEEKPGFKEIYNIVYNVNKEACKKFYVMKYPPPDAEPHICLDNLHGKTGDQPCIVYSFGIANQWTFDDYMITQGCHVFSFDPSMKQGKHKRHERHLFEPIGIGIINGTHTGRSTLNGGRKNYPVLTLEGVMGRYNHTHVTVVRMDVESAEWDVMEAWNKMNSWKHIDQLLVEIHMLNNRNERRYAEIMTNIPMTAFHSSRNTVAKRRLYKDMTPLYEMGYVKLPKTY